MQNTKILIKTKTKSYPMYFGDGILNLVNKLIKKDLPGVKKICIVCDKKIPKKFLKKLQKSLKKYNIIYADPPWSYNDKSMHRGGAERHYKTMNFKDICNLPVQKISADNSVLFLWATFPQIDRALKVIESWGFKYKTCAFNWIKTNKVNQDTFFWIQNKIFFWRPRPESNWDRRICNPLRNHSATWPN